MQATITPAEKSQVKIVVTADSAEVAPFRAAALQQLQQEVAIQGFRKGHAPLDKVEEKVGEAIVTREMLNLAIKKFYADAVLEHKVQVVAAPEVEVESVDPLRFTATVAVLPEVVLGDWQKIKIQKADDSVSDEEIEKALLDMRKRFAKVQEVKDRAAKLSDTAEIDFDGFDESGNPIPNTSSKNHPLELGSGNFIPGFEDGIVGMQLGESKDLQLTFPAEYHAKELAGKPVTFKVTLRQLFEFLMPEGDDELAKKVKGKDDATWGQVRSDVRDYLESDKKNTALQIMQAQLFEELVEVAKVEVPHALSHDEVHAMLDEQQQRIAQAGLKWDDYLKQIGKTQHDLHEEYAEPAEKRVKLRLILNKLADEEKVELTREEFDAELARQTAQMPEADAARVREQFGYDTPTAARFRQQLRLAKLVTQTVAKLAA